jgi:hypothetical protein
MFAGMTVEKHRHKFLKNEFSIKKALKFYFKKR